MVVMGLLLVQTLLAGADRLARVDAEGVLRWTDTGDEVALLGVNYYYAVYHRSCGTQRLARPSAGHAR